MAPLLEALNARPFQKRPGSRCSQFEAGDLPAMRPLPADRYYVRTWSKRKVHPDGCIQIKNGYYSVPCRYVSQEVDVAVSSRLVEVFAKSVRVAVHRRVRSSYEYAINPDHLPPMQRQLVQCDHWREKAREIGPHTEKVAEAIMKRRVHVILGVRAVMGLLRRARESGGPSALEAAGQAVGPQPYRTLRAVTTALRVRSGRSKPEAADTPPIQHENLRGGAYYASSS